MIEVSNLTKHYGSTLAINDVSFSVEENKVTGFLGPNGAGKSTTMRLMLGLDKGTGTVKYDGKKLSDYNNPAEVVGILLEMKAFHPTRSARNHLRVLAAAAGVSDERVDEVLEIVGLKDVANKKPGNFSLGMSQRLGLAAAILTKPKYLLLDEPANGLDPEGMAWLRKFMKNYATDGRAVLVSSHLLGEMSQMADDLVVIGRGELITAAPIDILLKENTSVTFVRTKQPKELEKLLTRNKIKFQKENNGYMVHDKTSDELGSLAHKHKLLLLELTPKNISLEDVFLRITSKAQQFKAIEEEKDND